MKIKELIKRQYIASLIEGSTVRFLKLTTQ